MNIRDLAKQILGKDKERENLYIDLRRKYNKLKNEHKIILKELKELKGEVK